MDVYDVFKGKQQINALILMLNRLTLIYKNRSGLGKTHYIWYLKICVKIKISIKRLSLAFQVVCAFKRYAEIPQSASCEASSLQKEHLSHEHCSVDHSHAAIFIYNLLYLIIL